MFTELIARKGIRGPAAVWLSLAALTLAGGGCAKVPVVGGKPAAKVTLIAAADCNACEKGTGYPLTLRMIQVTDASALTGTSLVQLWDREDKLLGAAFVAKDEEVVDPGATKAWKVELDPKTRSVVIVGNFCRAEGSCWYVVRPARGSISLKLRLESTCLRVTKR